MSMMACLLIQVKTKLGDYYWEFQGYARDSRMWLNQQQILIQSKPMCQLQKTMESVQISSLISGMIKTESLPVLFGDNETPVLLTENPKFYRRMKATHSRHFVV